MPSVPTRQLVVVGPYKYPRNPMSFGLFLFYLGICMFYHSVAMTIVMVLLCVVPLSLYVKIIEEKELAVRFGENYIRYRKETHFIVPFPRRHRRR